MGIPYRASAVRFDNDLFDRHDDLELSGAIGNRLGNYCVGTAGVFLFLLQKPKGSCPGGEASGSTDGLNTCYQVSCLLFAVCCLLFFSVFESAATARVSLRWSQVRRGRPIDR